MKKLGKTKPDQDCEKPEKDHMDKPETAWVTSQNMTKLTDMTKNDHSYEGPNRVFVWYVGKIINECKCEVQCGGFSK